MKSLSEMSVGEVAAYVAEHLRQSDIVDRQRWNGGHAMKA
jgi:hypothetical protein